MIPYHNTGGNIQGNLFHWLEEELEPLSAKHQQLVTVLEWARVEEFIASYRGYVDRPQKDRRAMARAFMTKAVYKLSTTRQLLDRLTCDKVLRRLCGWEGLSDIPSESTFSRAFAEFSTSELAQHVQEAFIQRTQSEQLVGHISRDATDIKTREKAVKKTPEVQPTKKRGRLKQGEVRAAPEPTRLERQLTLKLEEMLDECKQ